jgi:ankyrin repeat protein
MPRALTDNEISSIRSRYKHFIDGYEDDLGHQVDPLTFVDSNGDHLLHIASNAGDAETVSILLDGGVDIELLGDMGCTALHYAYMKRSQPVIALLKTRGESPDVVNQFGKRPEDS